MNYNMLSDISLLTSIPLLNLQKIMNIGMSTICEDIKETLNDKETICEVDIEIGKILINLEDDCVRYKFIPSQKLERSIVSTIVDGKSPLQVEVEDKLQKRIMNVYKELF